MLAASAFASNAAFAATADDVKWVNQCVDDNKNEGAKRDVVLKIVHLHEQQDGQQRNTFDHPVGKDP